MEFDIVEAFDIDEWSVENGNENFKLNGLSLNMGHGTIREIKPSGHFDFILANINKNILIDEMSEYTRLMTDGGYLLLSGFYEADIPDLLALAEPLGLKLNVSSIREDWAAIILKKNDCTKNITVSQSLRTLG